MVSDRVLKVHDILDDCDRAIRGAGDTPDRSSDLDRVPEQLRDAASRLASLAAARVSGEFGVYVNEKRRSLDSMTERVGRLTTLLEGLQTRDTSGDSPGVDDQ